MRAYPRVFAAVVLAFVAVLCTVLAFQAWTDGPPVVNYTTLTLSERQLFISAFVGATVTSLVLLAIAAALLEGAYLLIRTLLPRR